MNDDLKKLGDLLDERLEKALEPVKKDLNTIQKDVKELKEDVDATRGDIEALHLDVKGIRDKEGMSHSRNKREIDEIKNHLGLPLMPDTPEV